MEVFFAEAASGVALCVEAGAALIIAVGSLEALWRTAIALFSFNSTMASKKTIWTRYAMWLVLGLEFELAADIIRSAIAPSWTDIGQLAAIAGIRTFLNYFLERDIDKADVMAVPKP
jgi:uncharacterized membrane protein